MLGVIDPVAIAEGIVTDNGTVVIGLVTALFAATIGLRLAGVGVKRAGSALVQLAKGKS